MGFGLVSRNLQPCKSPSIKIIPIAVETIPKWLTIVFCPFTGFFVELIPKLGS